MPAGVIDVIVLPITNTTPIAIVAPAVVPEAGV
jgi:hypothetical protein